MSLHATLSEECIQYSVKKYFYDRLRDIDDVPIYFSYIYMLPMHSVTDVPHKTWIKFHFDGIHPMNGLSEARVNAYVFSRGNDTMSAGRLLAHTRDLLMAYLVNVDPDGNGLQTIPLLDINDDNKRVSSMLITMGSPMNEEVADDRTLYRRVPMKLKFATI